MTEIVNVTNFDRPYKGKDGKWRPDQTFCVDVHYYDGSTGEIKTRRLPIVPKFGDNARDWDALRSESRPEVIGSKDKFIEKYPDNVYNRSSDKKDKK